MKAKKIVAIVMGAAIAGTVAVGMSACSGGKKPESLKAGSLDIANYAAEYESDYSKKGYTGVEKVHTINFNDVVDTLDNSYAVVKESNDKYGVVNIYTGKKILTGLASIPEEYRLSSLKVIKVTFEAEDPSNPDEVEIYTYDGTKILAKGAYNLFQTYVTSLNRYVGNDTESSRVYQILTQKTVDDKAEDVEVFVKVTEDEETGDVLYSLVKKEDLKNYAPEYGVGSDQSGIKDFVYTASEDKPVEGEIKDYEFSQLGNKLTFYKNGTETGSVDVTNGTALAFMDNSFYYSVSTPVSPDATKGYNLAAIGSKVDYSLYKYDIVANTTTELNYDVIVTRMNTLYNYETKSYDAAIISGMKISDDGVAYGADEFTYVINKDFELCHDVTGLIDGAPRSIYNIGNDNYLIDDVIVDAELKVKSYISGLVYVDEGLTLVSNYVGGNYNYGFKDYTGKVVIAPEYSTENGGRPVFCGGVVLVENGDGEVVLLKKDGTITKVEDLAGSSDEKVTKEVVDGGDGFYAIKTTTTVEDGDDKVEVVYYAFDGTVLKNFNHDEVSSNTLADGSVLLSERVVDSEQNVFYTVYKLV